jgi:L-lactate dehydrogenase complex protein LldF
MARERAGFPDQARVALANPQLRRNLGKATSTIRAKRARVAGELPDWEALRQAGAAIKEETLTHLDRYLIQLEASVRQAGGQVHWADDARMANQIIVGLVQAAGAKRVVKVKSLTSDEILLNEALAVAGVTAVETDLAELIIQLAHERSSHILVPAIHKNRSEIRDLFRRTIAEGQDLTDEPQALAAAARTYLRRQFLSTPVAVSGANFAVAETGTICVVESEGNGRMCLTLPKTLITLMGIEKIIPTFRDLEVFLQLLPRSSTGERMNPYTSLWSGVTDGDGPQAFHLVLLDNGRTRVLADRVGRQTLRCIRCSACLNICPVYSRTGGHAYLSVYPGPIGAILTPQLVGLDHAKTLPYASTLCGACYEVCPVAINIPQVLLHLRGRITRRQSPVAPESMAMRSLAYIFADARRYERAQQLGRISQSFFTHGGVINRLPGQLAGWTNVRDLKPIPRQSFREWWRQQHKQPEKEITRREQR